MIGILRSADTLRLKPNNAEHRLFESEFCHCCAWHKSNKLLANNRVFSELEIFLRIRNRLSKVSTQLDNLKFEYAVRKVSKHEPFELETAENAFD